MGIAQGQHQGNLLLFAAGDMRAVATGKHAQAKFVDVKKFTLGQQANIEHSQWQLGRGRPSSLP